MNAPHHMWVHVHSGCTVERHRNISQLIYIDRGIPLKRRYE
jgi:hypothetical protein